MKASGILVGDGISSNADSKVQVAYVVISGKKLLFFILCICVTAAVPAIMGRALFLPATGRLYTRASQYPEVVYVPNYTEGPYVTARSAVLIEATTGTVVYGKNERMRMHPASTT